MPLKAVSNSHAMPFSEYAIRATQNLDLNIDESDLHTPEVEMVLIQ